MALVMFDEQILLDPDRIVLIREFAALEGKLWCHIHLLGVKDPIQIDKPIGELRDQLKEAIDRKIQEVQESFLEDHNL